MTPDTPNLSDAILLALSDAGWIGRVTECSATRITLAKKRGPRRSPRPIPTGLTLPRGVVWDQSVGRFVSRIWVTSRDTLRLGGCGPVQADLDALGALWQRACALRSAGMDKDAIREELGI